MNTETIAVIAAALFVVLAGFQIALALGAPVGRYAFGGRAALDDGRLPTAYRIASAIAALILLGFAWVVLARAGVVDTALSQQFLTIASWAIAAYLALNTAANLMGKTAVERYLFGGISAVLVVLCAIVAAAGPS